MNCVRKSGQCQELCINRFKGFQAGALRSAPLRCASLRSPAWKAGHNRALFYNFKIAERHINKIKDKIFIVIGQLADIFQTLNGLFNVW